MRRTVFGLLVVAAIGCRPPPDRPITPTGKVRVRVFTEPSPVRMLASAGTFVFVATDGDLERWDAEGRVLPVSAHGQIVALTPDVDRRWVWILTDRGLGHYDVAADVFQPLMPPASLGIEFALLAAEGASIAPSSEGGVWLGTAHGLVSVASDGSWSASGVTAPVNALARDNAGWLWAATKTGLVARKPTGEIVTIGATEGCAIVDPRLMVELPDAQMLVIGADENGRDLLAIGKAMAWSTYRALPDVKWDAAARRGLGAVVMAGEKIYRVVPSDASIVRPLARDGMRLVAVSGKPTPWSIDPVDVEVPPGAVTLASVDDQLLIGTRELGTARYRDGDQRPRAWLRRRQMFLDATALSVACSKQNDCWLATGTRQAWHWNGDRFAPRGPDEIALAIVRDPSGGIYALHRAETESAIKLSRIEDGRWTLLDKVALTTDTEKPSISFARFAASGSLWIGLRDRDAGEWKTFGIAVVDVASSRVTVHKRGGKLPIPAAIIGADVRGGDAWFATTDGVSRILNGKLESWNDEALRGVRALAIVEGGVIAATPNGALRFDGKSWETPPPLGFAVDDVVATRTGQVWMATDRGIAVWDGTRLRRVDTRRGLAEDRTLDLAVDQFDRVWARGPGSLALITQ